MGKMANKKFKSILLVAVALVIVISASALLRDHRLSADEENANGSAKEQQEDVKEEKKSIETVLPAKEEKQEQPKEEKKEVTPEKKEEVPEAPVEKEAEPEEAPPAPTAAPTPEPSEAPAPEPEGEVTPAPSEEPVPDPVEEPTPDEEPAEELLDIAAEAAQPEPSTTPEVVDWQVEIHMNNKGTPSLGDVVELEAVITADGKAADGYALTWQYNDGEGWKNVEGAEGIIYRFELTAENAGREYRVCIEA